MLTVLFLIISNIFMTYAWYGHLKDGKENALWVAILLSWGVAFFEYCFQVPANRYGHYKYGGPFDTAQLKIIQEVITLVVFMLFAIFYMNEKLRWNYLVAFALIIAAVAMVFCFPAEDETQKPAAEGKDRPPETQLTKHD